MEQERGCGWRKVGAMYLVGVDGMGRYCDRLPYPLEVCPVCGHGIKVGRGMAKINPLKLFGKHEELVGTIPDKETGQDKPVTTDICKDKIRPCWLCDPTEETAYLMNVGERFYPSPEAFVKEGIAMGFSKRIAQIPKEFKIGETIVYLSHPKACVIPEDRVIPDIEDNPKDHFPLLKEKYIKGIFTAFKPKAIERIYWQSEIDRMSDDEKKILKRRGVTPVGVPDHDPKHR